MRVVENYDAWLIVEIELLESSDKCELMRKDRFDYGRSQGLTYTLWDGEFSNANAASCLRVRYCRLQ